MGTDFDAALIAPLPESSSRRHFATFIFRLSALTPGSQARRREHLRSAFTWTTVHDCRVIIATSECRVGVFVPRTGHDEANDPKPAAVTQALQPHLMKELGEPKKELALVASQLVLNPELVVHLQESA